MNNQDFRYEVGRLIEAARRDMGITQVELARRVGVTQASVSNYERGLREVPLSTMIRFAYVFCVPLERLLPRAKAEAA